MKEHNFPFESFIGGWYISESICDELVSYFKNNKSQHIKGALGSNNQYTDSSRKKSIDICMNSDFFIERFPNYLSEFKECLELYKKKYIYSDKSVYNYGLFSPVNIQYYKKNWGFKNWHKENDGDPKVITRHLVFMTYLNDVDDGGTDFLYQKLTTPAIKGLTLIWPAGWTHTHKGQISKTKEKYILTSWLDFNRT